MRDKKFSAAESLQVEKIEDFQNFYAKYLMISPFFRRRKFLFLMKTMTLSAEILEIIFENLKSEPLY
ncbi:hypothetical protein CDL62_15560 [Alkalitalea saponilacus]|nr:hypothetical protein CDL62_14955 [Alkalitalea saponilacus]ASB50441.1 hypothetical protein CDL62_15435 [Alkalitalea saponilacus]ASB50459.1 hypothetical protein CDL62_15525 [Alkalitalea saponilacus]ASB50465.1 hypothetical protein CDL62_15560 [Alkalitalea saponilacus]